MLIYWHIATVQYAVYMHLSEHQKKTLRGLGHKLKPVVTVGNAGLTDPLLDEFRLSIDHHELMKIRINAGDRLERDRILAKLCDHVQATLVQRVGNTGLLLKLKQKDSRIAALLKASKS